MLSEPDSATAPDYVVPDIVAVTTHTGMDAPGLFPQLGGPRSAQQGLKPLTSVGAESLGYGSAGFIQDMPGFAPVRSDGGMVPPAAAGAGMATSGSGAPQIVPSLPSHAQPPAGFAPGTPNSMTPSYGPPPAHGLAAPTSAPPMAAHGPGAIDSQHLTAAQLSELELARQRAARAAAGRRQQLIAQKRAKQEAHQADLRVSGGAEKRTSRRQAAAGVAAVTAAAAALHSEDGGDESDDGDDASGMGASGSNPAKDARRLKRLLRNRVSAQQARERKKQYLTTLEDELKTTKERVDQLEKALASSESQNEALRRIIRSLQAGGSATADVGGLQLADPAGLLPRPSGGTPAAAGREPSGTGPAGHIPVHTSNGHLQHGHQPAAAPSRARSGELDLDAAMLGTSPPLSPQGSLHLDTLPSMAPSPAPSPSPLEGSGTSQPVRGFNMWASATPGYGVSVSGARMEAARSASAGLRMALGGMLGLEDDDEGLVVPQAPPMPGGNPGMLTSQGSLSLQHSS